jgi:hypothetical protein
MEIEEDEVAVLKDTLRKFGKNFLSFKNQKTERGLAMKKGLIVGLVLLLVSICFAVEETYTIRFNTVASPTHLKFWP